MNRTFAPFPANRPRRLRRDAATRALVREHRLAAEDLILPVFVLDGQGQTQDVASMPGVQRLSVDRLLPVAEACVQLGVPVMAQVELMLSPEGSPVAEQALMAVAVPEAPELKLVDTVCEVMAVPAVTAVSVALPVNSM